MYWLHFDQLYIFLEHEGIIDITLYVRDIFNILLVFQKPQKNVLHVLFTEFMDRSHDTNFVDKVLLTHVSQQSSFLKLECVGIIVTSIVR